MRNITVVTGTRAEYGLLKHIMMSINTEFSLNLQIVVTGTHLSSKYGMTINEIILDGFNIDEVCPILLDYEGRGKTAREMAIAINEFSRVFDRLKTDILLILGDRYEILAAAVTAMTMDIPIAHISGGESTEGAIDEQIRHSITKLSHLHFPGATVYAENIINMGEESWRVFDVGDPGIENIKLTEFMTQNELNNSIGIRVDENTFLVTYHPVTLERDDIQNQISNLISALRLFDNDMIITYPNSDNGGDKIIYALEEFALEKSNVHLFKNLGSLIYLSVMKYCGVIVGNSSSGIVEAPFFKKPVVNIGNRQKGRLIANNIIQSSYESNEIYESIQKAFTKEFLEQVKETKSLYGEGNTSKEIIDVLKKINIDSKLLTKKLVWSIKK